MWTTGSKSMTTATSSPTLTGGSPVESHDRTRRARSRVNWFLLVIALAVVATAASAVWWATQGAGGEAGIAAADKFTVQPRSFRVTLKERGELKAAKSTQLKCEVEGRSTIITLVPEGSQVKQGQLIAELASDQIEDRIRTEELKLINAVAAFEAASTELDIQRDKNASDIRKGELAVELAKLALDKYEKGDYGQRKRDCDIAIEQAQTTLERRKEDYEAADKLLKAGFITQAEYKEDQFNFQRAGWELEKSNLALVIFNAYSHVSEQRQRESDHQEAIQELERIRKGAQAEEARKVAAKEARDKELALIRDQLAKFRAQKEACRIFAPGPGVVVYGTGEGDGWRRSSEDQIREGSTVYERQVIATLPDTSIMVAVVRIHEAKTERIRIGQSAVIEVEGLSDRRFQGTVSRIAALADSENRWLNPDVKEYETEITLSTNDDLLKPGATAHVEVLVEQIQDALAVPIQSLFTKAGRRFVFRWESRTDHVTPQEVTIGATSTEWAEVLEGLNPSDRILMAFNDDHKRMLPDLPVAAPDEDFPTMPGGTEAGTPAERGQRMDRGPGRGDRPSGGQTTGDQRQRLMRSRGRAPGGETRGGDAQRPTRSIRPDSAEARAQGNQADQPAGTESTSTPTAQGAEHAGAESTPAVTDPSATPAPIEASGSNPAPTPGGAGGTAPESTAPPARSGN
jgi:HlyD family secretion protein